MQRRIVRGILGDQGLRVGARLVELLVIHEFLNGRSALGAGRKRRDD
jgi:hypothetical protein